MKVIMLHSSVLTYRERADAALVDAGGGPGQCLVLRPNCHFEAGVTAIFGVFRNSVALVCSQCGQTVLRFAVEDDRERVARIAAEAPPPLDVMYRDGELHLRSRETEVELTLPVRGEPTS